MGRIPEQTIEEVLGRTDILQVIQQYIALKRAGVNWKGLCPFHGEKTPSFHVHPGKGIYKCFGCGVGGDVITFVMQMEGWSFGEAVRQLAQRAGVQIEEEDEEEAEEARKRREARELYQRIMKLARGYFERQLMEPCGEEARAYLERRGVSAGVREAFGLGYAPESWQNLLDYLDHEGIKGALVERAGLALARQSGDGWYDRFRHRVMFPVIDIWGNTLAFGGRVLRDEDTPKYLNSPETKFYTKGKQLFGLHAAKQAIQRAEMALLVEGNFDVITLHAQGIQTAVAPMGTAFTEDQARLLGRYTRRVYLAFDGDKAGQAAMVKSLGAIESAGLNGYALQFPVGEDPDSFVRGNGADALSALIEKAPPIGEWVLERAFDKVDQNSTVEDKLKAIESVTEVLAQFKNRLKLSHYKGRMEEIARRLNIEPSYYEGVLKSKEKGNHYVKGDNTSISLTASEIPEAIGAHGDELKVSRMELELLILLMGHPEWLDGFIAEELQNILESYELAEFLVSAKKYYESHQRLDGAILVAREASQPFARLLSRAFTAVGAGKFASEEHTVKMYQDTLRSLKLHWAKRSLDAIDRQNEVLDFKRDREQYKANLEQKKLLEQFIAQLA